jgi:hypothetical protein
MYGPREMWTGAVGGTNGRMAAAPAPGLPCLSNLVYDGTMFIYGNNGPKGPDAGEEVGRPGAFAATCRPHGGGSSLFKDMHLFIGYGVAYNVYSLHDKIPRSFHVGTRSVTPDRREAITLARIGSRPWPA